MGEKEQNKMPDEIWVDPNAGYSLSGGFVETSCIWTGNHPDRCTGYLRKDLVVRKKKIKKLIKKNIHKTSLAVTGQRRLEDSCESYPTSLLDFREFIQDLQALLTGETDNE